MRNLFAFAALILVAGRLLAGIRRRPAVQAAGRAGRRPPTRPKTSARQAVRRPEARAQREGGRAHRRADLGRMVQVRQRHHRPDDAVGAERDGAAEIRRRARFPRPGDHAVARLCRRLEPPRDAAFHDVATTASRCPTSTTRCSLEPRHFGALSGMAQILKATGKKELALKAYQQRARNLSDDAQRPERGGDAFRRTRRRRHLTSFAAGSRATPDLLSPYRPIGMNIVYAAISLPARPDARAGRGHAARRLADRAAQPAGRRIRDRRRHAHPLRPCAGAGRAPTCRRSSSSTAPAPI